MQEQLPRVLSFPYPLRFLFASRPAIMGQVLGIVYCVIAGHLINKAGVTRKTARTGAVTLIQRFGSALNLNFHLMCKDARMPRAQGGAGAAHMLFLVGVYVIGADGTAERFRWVRAPTTAELAKLTHTITEWVGRFRQRQGLLERDGEQSYLAGEAVDKGTMDPLLAHSMKCREAQMPRSAAMRKSGHLPHCGGAAGGPQGIHPVRCYSLSIISTKRR